MSNNSRIAKNTIILYVRMLFSMLVSLYTSRIVLNILGVEDYGIYNVVGGVVSMLYLVNGSLNSATQRFITFELGKKNDKHIEKVFSISLNIYILIAITILFLGETLGLWFLNTQINIPLQRMNAANWVYQTSLFAFVINLFLTPYSAFIISNERMTAYATISIIETISRLGSVLLLIVIPFDKLKVYSIFVAAISLINWALFFLYCRKNFPETKYKYFWDNSLFKEMFAFAGWNFFGVGSGVLMKQGVNILINIFYGVTVNAARGIAGQVEGAITSFINNFTLALNPQITKSYASGEKEIHHSLLFRGSCFSFYLVLFFSLPVLLETRIILQLWLGMVPDYTVDFVKLTIIYIVINSISGPLITSMLATGKIKKYQIIVGGTQFLIFPLSYVALKIGYSPQSTFIIQIIIAIIMFFERLLLLRTMIQLQVIKFIKNVLFNVLVVTICAATIPTLLLFFIDPGITRLLLIGFSSVFSVISFVYMIGLSDNEKIFFKNTILLKLKIYDKKIH